MLSRIQFAVVMFAVVVAVSAYVMALRSDLRATSQELQASTLAASAYAAAADVMVAQVEALRAARAVSDAEYADRLACWWSRRSTPSGNKIHHGWTAKLAL